MGLRYVNFYGGRSRNSHLEVNSKSQKFHNNEETFKMFDSGELSGDGSFLTDIKQFLYRVYNFFFSNQYLDRIDFIEI